MHDRQDSRIGRRIAVGSRTGSSRVGGAEAKLPRIAQRNTNNMHVIHERSG